MPTLFQRRARRVLRWAAACSSRIACSAAGTTILASMKGWGAVGGPPSTGGSASGASGSG